MFCKRKYSHSVAQKEADCDAYMHEYHTSESCVFKGTLWNVDMAPQCRAAQFDLNLIGLKKKTDIRQDRHQKLHTGELVLVLKAFKASFCLSRCRLSWLGFTQCVPSLLLVAISISYLPISPYNDGLARVISISCYRTLQRRPRFSSAEHTLHFEVKW